MRRTFIAAITILALLPGLAFAAVQSISYNTSTPIPVTLTDWTGTLSFQQFDPSKGTLVKVKIDLSGSMSTVLTITNDSDSPSSGTAKTELQISVQDAGGNMNAPQLDLFSSLFGYSLNGHQSIGSGMLTQSGVSSEEFTSATVLNEFTGLGTIALPASSYTQTWLTNTGGNTYASQVTSACLTGCVTYYYVPEPASVLSLAGMLLPAAFLFRRRKA